METNIFPDVVVGTAGEKRVKSSVRSLQVFKLIDWWGKTAIEKYEGSNNRFGLFYEALTPRGVPF